MAISVSARQRKGPVLVLLTILHLGAGALMLFTGFVSLMMLMQGIVVLYHSLSGSLGVADGVIVDAAMQNFILMVLVHSVMHLLYWPTRHTVK